MINSIVMARTVYRADGQGRPVGKVNIEVRVEDANWFRQRRRVDQKGVMEPLYSVVWRFRDLFESEKEELLKIVDESDAKTRCINKLYDRIHDLEEKLAVKQGLYQYSDDEHKARFEEAFDNLEAGQGGEVPFIMLTRALHRNGLTSADVSQLIKEAMSKGFIYERRAGVYCKA